MPSFTLESASSRKNLIMIGVDEAGRGSWAGPLVAASCWIDFNITIYLIQALMIAKS
jgi:ribonuclease HIII